MEYSMCDGPKEQLAVYSHAGTAYVYVCCVYACVCVCMCVVCVCMCVCGVCVYVCVVFCVCVCVCVIRQVKTGVAKELAPYDEDWYFVRAGMYVCMYVCMHVCSVLSFFYVK